MALTTEQLSKIKENFDRFDDEEKRQVLNALTGKDEQQTAELDESSKFLLSMVTGNDEQKQADDEAVNNLMRLAQGG